MPSEPVIAVHGGAWAIPEALWEVSIKGVKKSALSGYSALCNRESAVDAVEEAVVVLEDDYAFDAAVRRNFDTYNMLTRKGSVLTYDEQVEMDALIMDGQDMSAGCVAAIKNIENPIRVARMVMERTLHVLLVGEGANKFADSQGIKRVSPDILITKEARAELEKYKRFKTTVDSLFCSSRDHDTVGCVALDVNKHVACGTSTGGITAKMPGRVGDTPIVGCGGLADDHFGAVSTTGHGEAIIKVGLARAVIQGVSAGHDISTSLDSALNYMQRRVSGYGGAVAVSVSGDVGAKFTTEKMAWAYVKNNKLHYGLHTGQHEIEDIKGL